MRIVIALGGNALMKRGEKPDAQSQIDNVNLAAAALAPLAEEHEIVITHGNGPQVGVLALQSANPTKFVGEVYDKETADKMAAERGWVVKADGPHFRRVVGSPKPQRVIETRLVRSLINAGAVVVCSGGGGVPVIRNEKGKLQGVEAVIDKDLTAAVLAEHLEAAFLMILTDVPAVLLNYGQPDEEAILRATPGKMRALGLPAGSMGPKVEACCRFVELTGDTAAIGRLEDAKDIIAGNAGTIVTPGGNYGGPDDIQPPIPAAPDPRQRRAGGGVNLLDGAVALGAQHVLHLHGFHHRQGFA